MKHLLSAVLAFSAVAVASSAAPAAVLLNLNSVTPSGDGFVWSYSVDLEPDTNLRINDFVVAYDVQGLVPGSSAFASAVPQSFSVAELATGNVVPFTDPTHDFADVLNINVTLTDGGPVVPAPLSAAVHLGDLTFHSSFGTSSPEGEFGSVTQQQSNLGDFYAIGLVELPAVPEPASLAGLVAPLGLLARRRR